MQQTKTLECFPFILDEVTVVISEVQKEYVRLIDT